MIHIKVDGLHGDPAFLSDYVMSVYPNARLDSIIRAESNYDIYLNGKIINDEVFVTDGDQISLNLFFFHLGLPPVLDILYEDENFIAIEKMPGVPSFDENRTGAVNVYDMTIEYMLQKGEYHLDSLTIPYLCYILSEYAGGILLIAKHEEAYRYIATALNQRKILITYEGIIAGHPERAIDENLNYMTSKGLVTPEPIEGSFPIVTRYKTLEKLPQHAKVEITPVTYSRYQVYAHMAYIDHQIIGDHQFGNKRFNRKMNMDYESLWLKDIRFSIGESEPFNYLNHVHLTTDIMKYSNHLLLKGKKK